MKQARPDSTLQREEYLSRAHEFAKRGSDLPQTKLCPDDVHAIRSAVRQRDGLREHIRNNLSNQALADKFGVHRRTIEKIVQLHTWSQEL
jgi:hypothetical protein